VYPAPKSAAKSFDLNQDRSSNKDNKTVQSAERNIYHSEIALISSTDQTGFLKKSSKSKKEASSAVAITKPNWKGGCFHLNNKQMSNKEYHDLSHNNNTRTSHTCMNTSWDNDDNDAP
jgi:hypothetical protein